MKWWQQRQLILQQHSKILIWWRKGSVVVEDLVSSRKAKVQDRKQESGTRTTHLMLYHVLAEVSKEWKVIATLETLIWELYVPLLEAPGRGLEQAQSEAFNGWSIGEPTEFHIRVKLARPMMSTFPNKWAARSNALAENQAAGSKPAPSLNLGCQHLRWKLLLRDDSSSLPLHKFEDSEYSLNGQRFLWPPFLPQKTEKIINNFLETKFLL